MGQQRIKSPANNRQRGIGPNEGAQGEYNGEERLFVVGGGENGRGEHHQLAPYLDRTVPVCSKNSQSAKYMLEDVVRGGCVSEDVREGKKDIFDDSRGQMVLCVEYIDQCGQRRRRGGV